MEAVRKHDQVTLGKSGSAWNEQRLRSAARDERDAMADLVLDRVTQLRWIESHKINPIASTFRAEDEDGLELNAELAHSLVGKLSKGL
jgi:hypothetical protein